MGKFHSVMMSTQHAEPSKATRRNEVADYTGADETAPSMVEMHRLNAEEVIKATLSDVILKNGQPALTLYGDPLYGDHTHRMPQHFYGSQKRCCEYPDDEVMEQHMSQHFT